MLSLVTFTFLLTQTADGETRATVRRLHPQKTLSSEQTTQFRVLAEAVWPSMRPGSLHRFGCTLQAAPRGCRTCSAESRGELEDGVYRTLHRARPVCSEAMTNLEAYCATVFGVDAARIYHCTAWPHDENMLAAVSVFESVTADERRRCIELQTCADAPR